MEKEIILHVNGMAIRTRVSPGERLLDTLRKRLRLTGTKEGCGIGECGACTVLIGGQAENACLILTESVEGEEIETIEGMAQSGRPDRVQEAFMKYGAVQCGFCTPGLIMSAEALLRRNPHPDREQIQRAIAGNLCRCTGYEQVLQAVLHASKGDTDAASDLPEDSEPV